MDTWYGHDLTSGSHDKEAPAGPAFVVGIDPVVGLLFAHVVESFVLAGRHGRAGGLNEIYTFGRHIAPRGEKPWV